MKNTIETLIHIDKLDDGRYHLTMSWMSVQGFAIMQRKADFKTIAESTGWIESTQKEFENILAEEQEQEQE